MTMDIIEYHNYCRGRDEVLLNNNLIVDENVDYIKLWILSLCHQPPISPLQEHIILNTYALKASKWMARRGWNVYWNFDKTRNDLLSLGFDDVDYNVAVGDNEEFVMKHFLNNRDKKEKVLSSEFKYIGYGVFDGKYKYWTILYAR